MKQHSLITAILFLSCIASAQNLIPNPGAEEYSNCPESFGEVQENVISWQGFRGTPDYFNNCSESSGLGWNNTFGYQQPRTGKGYIGIGTYSKHFANAREIVGVELLEPMVEGETYFVTFFMSLARNSSSAHMATNIGCLFMVENYLETDEQSTLLNFSHYETNELVTDTSIWVEQSFSFTADSAYTTVAFGNFYEDNLTNLIDYLPEENTGMAYYYLDDFCITTSPNGCELTTTINESEETTLNLYPNPAEDFLEIEAQQQISSISIFNAFGRKVREVEVNSEKSYSLDVRDVPNGMYILEVEFSNRIKERKKFMRK